MLQNILLAAMKHPGLELKELTIEHGVTKFDLTLTMSETPDGLIGAVEYCTDLFDDATIARMIAHFRTLLEGIAADSGRRISALPLLSSAERRQLLEDWNATEAAYPANRCLAELLAEQVERTPDAVALAHPSQSLTYAALNARACRLAHHLQSLGAGPETLIGVCLDRSPLLLIALLATLKASAAYLPLDPFYPKDRLRFMLEDAQVSLLITDKSIYDLRFTIWTLRKG